MDGLIQCAAVVVNASLYEAGNGPGVDAYGRGAPIAMSNIPSFTEHLDILGIRAQIFDPRSPEDIANKILAILENPEGGGSNPGQSQGVLGGITWDKVAKAYLSVFHETINDQH
jgi:glycosyltransferase involved in cell wall biosynthesis